MTTVIFSHGKESGPQGGKIRALSVAAEKCGYAVLSPDFRDLPDPDARVERLCGIVRELAVPAVLVGSSMGGYASLVASTLVPCVGLFLLAPAIGLPGYRVTDPRCPAVPTEVVHGWSDEVVPAQHAIDWAGRNRCVLHLLDDGHRLQVRMDQLVELFGSFLELLPKTK